MYDPLDASNNALTLLLVLHYHLELSILDITINTIVIQTPYSQTHFNNHAHLELVDFRSQTFFVLITHYPDVEFSSFSSTFRCVISHLLFKSLGTDKESLSSFVWALTSLFLEKNTLMYMVTNSGIKGTY